MANSCKLYLCIYPASRKLHLPETCLFAADKLMESGHKMQIEGTKTQNLEGNIQNEGVVAQNVDGHAQVIGKQLSKLKF